MSFLVTHPAGVLRARLCDDHERVDHDETALGEPR